MPEVPDDIPSSDERQQATPVFVQTEEDRRRWAACQTTAVNIMGASPDSEDVWFFARSLYFSDLPTKRADRIAQSEISGSQPDDG